MNENRIVVWVLMASLALLSGCNSVPRRDPNYAPVRPVVPPPNPVGDGAIYHGGYSLHWVEDLTAKRVGDILTVSLSESTNATKSAKTDSKKSNSNTVNNPTLLGLNPKFNYLGSNASLAIGTSSAHDFSGEGSAEQNNRLTGDITVTVTEVLPNGYLTIRGEKRIGINQGNEYIKLSGIVRPYDITADNVVESTKIADPTIVYVGDGQVADASVMGWLSRFFNSAVMPF
jgi:flagellar L-ring protein precursor FlgH